MDEIIVISKDGSIFVQNLTMDKLPEIDESKLGKNPFSQELVIEATKIEDSDKFIRDEDGVMLPAHHYVEKQKYVKFYKFKGARDHILKLSAGATKMILYIGFTMDGSKDYLRITPDTYSKKTERGSLNTYKRAIEELILEGYLTPTMYKYTYWVNPAMLFCANRINKYPDKVQVKGKSMKDEKQEFEADQTK